MIELLRTGTVSAAGKAWALSCSNSGRCIPACPEGVNPRKMLALARLELRRQQGGAHPRAARQAAQDDFRAMGDAIRLLLSVQLRPEDIQRLLPGAMHQRQRQADVVFYFGCNILRTPEIALTVLDVLERLGVDYEVLGGTQQLPWHYLHARWRSRHCPRPGGTNHAQHGWLHSARGLTWCPSCNVHMQDFVLDVAPPAFPMRHVTAYLAERLPEAAALHPAST